MKIPMHPKCIQNASKMHPKCIQMHPFFLKMQSFSKRLKNQKTAFVLRKGQKLVKVQKITCKRVTFL